MTSLLDIGPLTETVVINGVPIEVRGLTPEGFFFLLHRFPSLKAMFGKSEPSIVDMTELAPNSIAFALALITVDRIGHKTTKSWIEEIERVAAKAVTLPAHHQMKLFQCGLRVSFPDGFGPFMEAVVETAESINRVSGKTASGTRSSKSSRRGFITDSPGMRLGRAAPSASSVH